MIHTYENALKIRKAYKYLIDKYLETGSRITDLCIIPANLRQLTIFLDHYKAMSGELALQLFGFDETKVRIVVIHEQTLTDPGFMIDLEEYLTRKGIPKRYDPVTRTLVTLN